MNCPYEGKTVFDLTEEEKQIIIKRAKVLKMVYDKDAPPDPLDRLILKIAKGLKK